MPPSLTSLTDEAAIALDNLTDRAAHLINPPIRRGVTGLSRAGKTVFSIGDIDSPVFPRSACKAMQALPLVESGAADAYGFGNRELALSASSHSGEPEHAALAAAMLKVAGRGEADLECAAHW